MELSHVDENGAKMVDVGEKSATKRKLPRWHWQ